jgi:phosphopantothenoylcysteine synthetase/decarboxylase
VSSFGSGTGDVVYLVVCAAPPARQAAEVVELLRGAGWRSCVVVTPAALAWVDAGRLERASGHPVRSRFRGPDDPQFAPRADALIVAPASFNTINRWAAGLNDSLALGLANEALGAGVPVAAVPRVGPELGSHPAYEPSLDVLRRAGVAVSVPGDDTSTDFLTAVAEAVDRLGPTGGPA